MVREHLSKEYRKKAISLRRARSILLRQQQRIYELYARHFPPEPQHTVLDLGINATLELPEQYFFEDNYPHREQILAAGLEEGDIFERCYPQSRYIKLRRGEALPFDDHAFDVVFCSAVIEHVGSRQAQRRFLNEVLRVGKGAFLTTPNRWYPVELHTVTPLLHWLPAPLYRRLYNALGFEFFAREENLNLLDRSAIAELLPPNVAASIIPHRFLGLISNYIVVVKGTTTLHVPTSR